jgi:S1-C subfamily serine protease
LVVKIVVLFSLFALAAPVQADRQTRATPLVRAVQMIAPSVVNITATQQGGRNYLDDMFNNLLPSPRSSRRGSLGTGVVVDGQRGLIVTNAHVVQAAAAISVQLGDRREFRARLLGSDPDNDIAVLKVDSVLPQAILGDSDDIMIGEQVLAIGNPFGFSHTVTVGVVSALHRRVKTGAESYVSDLVQTDASINPGNSGGPLLNIDGEVVGVNTMIHRSAQGIGFAIPINKVKQVVEIISRQAKYPPAWLGLVLEDGDGGFASGREFNLIIRALAKNSPAERAGLALGDVVLAINGVSLYSMADYTLALRALHPGQQAEIKLYNQEQGPFSKNLLVQKFGLEEAKELFQLRTGLIINKSPERNGGFRVVNSGAEGAGAGGVVMKIGEYSLNDAADFLEAMVKFGNAPHLKVLLRRGNFMRWLLF